MKKGNIIFYTNKVRGGKYSELREIVVTKVGRDYFETALNHRKIPLKFDGYEGSWIDGYTSDEHNRYFASEYDYAEYLEKIALRKKITDFVNDSLFSTDVYQLRNIVENL